MMSTAEKTSFARLSISEKDMLPTVIFREMDQMAVEQYKLPIESMMEKAGTQLARFAAFKVAAPENILIGVGRGNNGGGGLVAAVKLLEMGYPVSLHIPDERLNKLAQKQLKRALKNGAKQQWIPEPGLFIDAYLGFSQYLPLSLPFMASIYKAGKLSCPVISLDLPTGFDIQTGQSLFDPDYILTLAVPKIELFQNWLNAQIYLADIGIPEEIYNYYGMKFYCQLKEEGILKLRYK